MYPEIFSSNGQRLAILSNIKQDTAQIKRIVNGEFTFSFEALEEELKSEYFVEGNVIKIDGQTFDISYLEQDHSTDISYTLKCEHVNYRLQDGDDNKYETFAATGTPAAILAEVLNGTEFSVGTIEFTQHLTISSNREITKKQIIKDLAAILGAEIDYSNEGFTIDLLNTIGQDQGFQVRFGKNLRSIKRIMDKRGSTKSSYSIEILELKNSNEYKENGLDVLEIIGLGDTIRAIDELTNLDIQSRILSITYNPIFAYNTHIEIVNKIELFADIIEQIGLDVEEIKDTAVMQDTVYNNVSISRDYGFRATLDNGSARTTFAGDTIAMEVSDGQGGWIEALKFDSVTGKFVFSGDIEAADISGSDISGTTISGNTVKTSDSSDRMELRELSGDHAISMYHNNQVASQIYMDENNGLYLITYSPALNGDITINAAGDDLYLLAGDNITMNATDQVRLIGSSIWWNGNEVSFGGKTYYAGNGLDLTSGEVFDIDPSEVAGDGIIEDGSHNFAVDPNRVVLSSSSQEIRLQFVDGNLEYWADGSWTALQNI